MNTNSNAAPAALPPVMIGDIKVTSDPEILQLRLEQKFEKEVSNANALLGLTMEGHSSFAQGKPRVAFQNFSKTKAAELGLAVGRALPADLGAKLVIHEFCEGDTIPEEAKGVSTNYTGKNTYVRRTWIDKASGLPVSEQPKSAGKGGAPVTRDGKEIYRNVYLTIKGMTQEDLLVQHNNAVVGSSATSAAATQQAAVVGEPALNTNTGGNAGGGNKQQPQNGK